MTTLFWTDRATRDAAYDRFFKGRPGCSKFDCIPNDDGMEDGTFELTNFREGYHIEVPATLHAAWLSAQRERDARGLKGPAHATTREALYRQMLDAA